MKYLLAVLILTCPAVLAQNTEFGLLGGLGVVGAEDLGLSAAPVAGLEVCGNCAGRFAAFAAYSHLFGTKDRAPRITGFDFIEGGLRFQGGKRVRPFFDVGLAAGWDSFEYGGGRDRHGNIGMVFAGGATVGRGTWYVRPQVRVYGLRALHIAIWAGVGVGARF